MHHHAAPTSCATPTGTLWIDPTTMLVVREDQMDRKSGSIIKYGLQQLVSKKRAARQYGS
jgi:hypothetical protein